MTVLLPAQRYRAIDGSLARVAGTVPPRLEWLLKQTLATGASRRALLASLGIQPSWRILDLACGFGASSLELAAFGPRKVVGLDADRAVLNAAATVAANSGLGASVALLAGDAYGLPFSDATFDLAFCRFLFQHLSDPLAVAAEMGRVLVPGGTACVVDVDDGLSISEPPPSPAFKCLAAGLTASQAAAGGDRRVGRRLPGILDAEGLAPTVVLVLPQATYRRTKPGDSDRTVLIKRLETARAAIVGGGHIAGDVFDADLVTVANERPGATCEIEAHLAVVAIRSSS